MWRYSVTVEMATENKTVKFTTREMRITREMTPHEFVRSVRGAQRAIARELGVSPQAVNVVLCGRKKSRRINAAIQEWIRREIKRRAA